LRTLTDAQGRTGRWFGIMESLKRSVPDQTWLTNVAVEHVPDVPDTIRINGLTVNQARVGETMYRLTQQPQYYKTVDLRFTQTTKVDAHDNVEFELAAHLNQPELEAKVEQVNATKSQ
jgi:Tfp pilus assembly protein PilN